MRPEKKINQKRKESRITANAKIETIKYTINQTCDRLTRFCEGAKYNDPVVHIRGSGRPRIILSSDDKARGRGG